MEEKKIPGHSARPHPDQAAMSGGQKRPCLPNPRLDANFKGMFTKDCEDSHIALKSFLSAMIGEPVTDVIVRENEEASQYKGQKKIHYDIKCQFGDGTKAQIEMQGYNRNLDYDKRVEYYVARLLSSASVAGDKWKMLPKVYQISVLNFTYDSGNKEPLHHYTMTDSRDSSTLSGILNVIFMELPKLPPVDAETDIDSLPSAVKWGKFIQEADNPEKQDLIDRLARSEKGIMSAQAVLSAIDEDGWRAFEHWQETVADRIDRMEPILKAEERGEERGKQETARNMLATGLGSIEQIAQVTGLPIADIEKLAANP